jgi:hypothetical protein
VAIHCRAGETRRGWWGRRTGHLSRFYPDFGRSVNPIPTFADYALHHITDKFMNSSNLTPIAVLLGYQIEHRRENLQPKKNRENDTILSC